MLNEDRILMFYTYHWDLLLSYLLGASSVLHGAGEYPSWLSAILKTAASQEVHNSSVLCLLFFILPLGANHRKKKDSQETSGNSCKQMSHKAKTSRTFNPPGVRDKPCMELPVNRVIDVDGVKLEDTGTRSCDDSEGNLSFEVYISELRSCQGRMRTGVYRTSDLPSLITVKSEKNKGTENQYKATFVWISGFSWEFWYFCLAPAAMEMSLRDVFLQVLSCFQYPLPSTSLPDRLWWELEPTEWKFQWKYWPIFLLFSYPFYIIFPGMIPSHSAIKIIISTPTLLVFNKDKLTLNFPTQTFYFKIMSL